MGVSASTSVLPMNIQVQKGEKEGKKGGREEWRERKEGRKEGEIKENRKKGQGNAGTQLGVRPREKDRRRRWQPTPALLPGKSHGWRSLAGWSPWG